MRLLNRLLAPKSVVHAHCDLPCGVYDPAQALIEAQSVKAIAEKYAANDDPALRPRCLIIKVQCSELVKHHLWLVRTAGIALTTRRPPQSCSPRPRRFPSSSGRQSRPNPASFRLGLSPRN